MPQIFCAFSRLVLSALLITQWSTAYAEVPFVGPPAPALPGENIPAGLEDVPPQLQAVVQKIAALPAQLAGQGAQMTIPEIAPLQTGMKLYMANRATCIADQARASGFCRSETNPELQTQLAVINGIIAGVNTVAVNDACSTASKVMGLAQMALTGYTAACGLMRKKCEMSCTQSGNGMKQILQALHVSTATCAGIPVACAEGMALLETYRGEGTALAMREASISDPKSIHAKLNLCTATYGLLLVSAGLSIMSVAKTFSGSQKCDDDSKSNGSGASAGKGSGGTPVTSAPATSTTPVASEGQSTMGTTEMTPLGNPSMSRSTAAESTPTTAPGQDPSAPTTVIVPLSDESRSRTGTNIKGNSELRAYLPDGEKAAVAAKGQIPRPIDITAPNGPTNFEKMRNRFNGLGLDE